MLFAEAHRLLGEVLERLIEFRDWKFAASAGPRARKELEKAIKLDPQDADAHISLGLSFLFTPKIFGGNLKKAIQSLEKGLELSRTEHQLFLAHTWLGKAYLKKGKQTAAKEHLQQALEIYPNSGWAKELLSGGGGEA